MHRRVHIFAVALWAAAFFSCAPSRYTPARVASENSLDYPLSAQLDRIEGEVEVGVFVDAHGTPVSVQILKSSGYAVLDSAAYHFAQSLTFNPAKIDEKPIGSWTKLVLRYKLTDVVFEKDKWVYDVLYLQKKIAQGQDSTAVEENLRRLYIRYVGLAEYAKKTEDMDLNYTIQQVIQPATKGRWIAFWPYILIPFALFDDLLTQYPQSPVADQVREELINMLIETEAQIRVRALKSRKIAVRADQLIQLIEKRVQELQPRLHES